MAAERLPPPASLDTTSPAIYFYYDIASPFSYLALELLNRYIPKEWPEVKLELRPCSLYHIRLWAGNWPGPPGNDFRMRTLMRDTARMRKLYGIPIAPINKVFPANAGGANKLLAWFHINRPELVAPATLALFEAYWRDELVPSEPDVVAKYVGPVYPEGVEALRALYADASKMDSKEVTDLLEAHAKEASESYAIGTPFFNVVKPVPGGKPKVEGFFGTDRMEHVADFLDLPWKGWIPPSATRTPGTEELIDVGDASIMFKQVTPLIEALTKAEAEAKAAAEVKSKV
ncbi:thioredoxin-like protein [Hyaloraphidium curvatum]|nr:thioredoxin-like protein [Hyaloraphidium curvatum]